MRTFQVYGCTDRGAVREKNEDHLLIGRFVKNRGGMGLYISHDDDSLLNYGMLFAVADGIGGENAGEVASRLALNAFERQFYGAERTAQDIEIFMNAVTAAAKRANDTILQAATARPELAGMGCTLAGVCLIPSGYLVFSAGDSRVYRLRNSMLKPLTEDDTLTNIAVRAGQMSLEEAAESESRHTITNSLGGPSFNLKISQGPELRDNDIILICSDGLHDLVSKERLSELLAANESLDIIAQKLTDEAMSNGGHDNISVIVIRSDIFEDGITWHKTVTPAKEEDDVLPISAEGQEINEEQEANQLTIPQKVSIEGETVNKTEAPLEDRGKMAPQ